MDSSWVSRTSKPKGGVLILSSSGLWWPNGSQMASGGSFWVLLGAGGQMAVLPGMPLEILGMLWNPGNPQESEDSIA